MTMTRSLPLAAIACFALVSSDALVADDATATTAAKPVSYYEQVRPILQANCQGCHQPAKAGGDYVMTEFALLVQGGESESRRRRPR